MKYFILRRSGAGSRREVVIFSQHRYLQEAYEELDLLAECIHSTSCEFTLEVVDQTRHPAERPSVKAASQVADRAPTDAVVGVDMEP